MSKAKSFMSIGEVLKELKHEFPDVSISKIRFLESEGLIEPERTVSGYRKFYSTDVARLRYILRLQRDHFVPLKVIRRRLDHFDPAQMGDEPATPDGNGSAAQPMAGPVSEDDDLEPDQSGIQLSFEELTNASGLSAPQVQELEEYGLIDAHSVDGQLYFDGDDLIVAKLARDFSKYGLEPRHLKMYKNFAEKEGGLFEQVVLPRSGRTDGGRQVIQSLTELAKLSKRLKHALLKANLRNYLHS